MINLPYSGRLVTGAGEPVEGPVDLIIEFYDDAQGGDVVGGPFAFPQVTLQEGIFQINLALSSAELHQIFKSVQTQAWLQLTDTSNGSVYPRQLLAATPYALKIPVDEASIGWNDSGELTLLDQASVTKIDGVKVSTKGASNGQVLSWDDATSSWKPNSIGLSDGDVTEAKITDGAVTSAKIQDGTLGLGDIDPSICAAGEALRVNPGGTAMECFTAGLGGGDINNGGNATGADLAMGSNDAFGLDLKTNNTVRLAIDASGNVGIGEANPTAKLQIKGPATGSALSGLVTINTTNDTVTGDGSTLFLTELAVGDAVNIFGKVYTVEAIATDASMTIDRIGEDNQGPISAFKYAALVSIKDESDNELVKVRRDGAIALKDNDGSDHYGYLKAPAALANDVTLTLPPTLGTSGQVLATDGNGILSWTNSHETSGVQETGDGTVGAPSYAFDSDNTTGLFKAGSGIGLATGGVLGAQVSATGLGVGTAPSHKLHVLGSGGAVAGMIEASDASESAVRVTNTTGDFGWRTEAGKFHARDYGNTSDRLTINAAGYVGIGTVSPNRALKVVGDGAFVSNSDVSGTLSTGALSITNVAGTASINIDTNEIQSVGNTLFLQYDENEDFDVGFNDLFVETSTGLVGVGHNSPVAKLHVDGGTVTALQVETDDVNDYVLRMGNKSYVGGFNYHELLMLNDGSMTWNLPDNGTTPADLRFYSRDTSQEVLRIGSNGNVGIGSASPAESLDVNGNVKALGAIVDNGTVLTTLQLGQTNLYGTNQSQRFGINHNPGAVDGIHFGEDTYIHGNLNQSVGTSVNMMLGGNSTGGYAFDHSKNPGVSAFKIRGSGGVRNDFIIDGNGNIGIGTTVPNAKLSLANNVATGFLDNYSEYQIILYDGGSAANAYGLGVKGSNMVFNSASSYSFDSGGTVTRMVIDASGNVGIGTTSPGATLEVRKGSGDASLEIVGGHPSLMFNGGITSIKTYASSGGGDPTLHRDLVLENTDSNGQIELIVGAVRVMTADRNGSGDALVGINDTTPDSVLEVVKDGVGDILNVSSTEAADGDLLKITNDGKVGIGTTSPTSRLSVVEAESVTQTNFTQSNLYSGVNVVSDYTSGAYTPGLFWSTADSNPTKPKAGIHLHTDGAGSTMIFGTSNVYATGITNEALKIDPLGNTTISGKVNMGHERIPGISLSIGTTLTGTATVSCTAGNKVIGGGCSVTSSDMRVYNSYPDSDTSWSCSAYNGDAATQNLSAHVICARIDD